MTRTLTQQLATWRPFRALVVGDFMLDRLVYGNVDRISPEAPVPVLHVQRTEDRPGGASNLCLNLAAMHAEVVALGVVGQDGSGARLVELLEDRSIACSGLIRAPERETTVKQRLIGLAQHRHPQNVLRMDYETTESISDSVRDMLVASLDAALETADVVCLEDYGKGVCDETLCRELIDRCRTRGIPVLVDPASVSDYTRYSGASVITPNRTEAAKAVGDRRLEDAPPEAFEEVAGALVESLDLDAAVITLDRHGAMLLERGGTPTLVPTVARRVYDVTGAGDMVIAALAAARANGLDWPDSVRMANAAAGLEVEEFGVVPIPFERIHAELLAHERQRYGKVRALDELAVEVEALRQQGRTVCVTNGCFDVLHVGHLSLLHRAAEFADFLVVAVNSDDSVRRLGKGPDRPVNSQQDRAELLGGLHAVDAVVIFDEDTPERVIEAVRPDVLVKGAEYTLDQVPGAAFVMANGGRVELLEMIDGRSTTGVVERIRAGS